MTEDQLTIYSKTAFNYWTDGSKCVIDTLGCMRTSDFPPNVELINCDLLSLESTLEHYAYRHTTFYIVADTGTIELLRERFLNNINELIIPLGMLIRLSPHAVQCE